MFIFLKAQIASIIATCVDFAVTILLVEVFYCWYVPGVAAGTIAGGITYFLMGRGWVFNAKHKEIKPQIVKYILVWIVYLILSTGIVFAITHFYHIRYLVSKFCVAVLMSITYNYVLNRRFVFRAH
jgi:putative flippase GtrA